MMPHDLFRTTIEVVPIATPHAFTFPVLQCERLFRWTMNYDATRSSSLHSKTTVTATYLLMNRTPA